MIVYCWATNTESVCLSTRKEYADWVKKSKKKQQQQQKNSHTHTYLYACYIAIIVSYIQILFAYRNIYFYVMHLDLQRKQTVLTLH